MILMEQPPKLEKERTLPAASLEPAVLPALGQLLRGLSALFWGIPVVLITAVQASKAEPARLVHLWSTVVSFGLLVYGVHLLGSFQPQERVWQLAVDRARISALINFGFSPFVYWWSRRPGEPVFQVMIDLLMIGFLVFLIELNPLIDRLVAMLPDEGLRQETRLFTRISRWLLSPILGLGIFYFTALHFEPSLPVLTPWLAFVAEGGLWMTLFVLLLPIALTMALLWKIKEVLFHSVFGR